MRNIYKIILVVTDLKRRDKKSEHIITKFPIEIGRDVNCDILLEDERKLVSRNHSKIILVGEQLKLIDLGSRNATYINQKKITPNTEYDLKNSDIIKVGEFLLEITNIYKEEIRVDDSQKTMMFCSPFDEIRNILPTKWFSEV